MARKPKQFRKRKLNYLDFLKALTKWLGSRYRDEQKLDSLIKSYELNNQKAFSRIVSYAYNRPHIIWYINKYFNHLFDFHQYDTKELIYNLCFVFDSNFHNKSSKFFYLKSQELRDNNKKKVKKVIKDYFEIVKKKHINDIELNYFYHLFNIGVIKEEELEKLNKTINGEESTLNLDPIELEEESGNYTEEDIKNYIEKCKTEELPENIKKFCQELKERKPQRENCQTCKLFESPMVVLDTNASDFGGVNFAFLALNPGKDETIYDKPLVGRAGELQRRKMFFLPPDITWVLTNLLLCFTRNQSEIGKTTKEILKVSQHCTGFITKIFEKFPAQYYIPVGKPAAELFGITGSITENSGKLFNIQNTKVIPLVHPSGVQQYHGKLEEAYNYGFNRIYEIAERLSSQQSVRSENNSTKQFVENIQENKVNKQYTNTQNNRSTSNNKNKNSYLKNIPQDKILNNDDEVKDNGLTLFDSFNLDNKNMLMIYLDDSGKKYYLVKDLNVPFYIKADGEHCDILIDDPNMVCYTNGYNRNKVLKSLRENMEVNKKSAVE